MCGILTAAGAFTDDPNDPGYRARTDARASSVTDIPFFYFPYPCTCDIAFLPPPSQQSGKGNVFSSVCLSFGGDPLYRSHSPPSLQALPPSPTCLSLFNLNLTVQDPSPMGCWHPTEMPSYGIISIFMKTKDIPLIETLDLLVLKMESKSTVQVDTCKQVLLYLYSSLWTTGRQCWSCRRHDDSNCCIHDGFLW